MEVHKMSFGGGPPTESELLPLTNDIVFKEVVGTADVLSALISDILKEDVEVREGDIAKEMSFASASDDVSNCRLDVFCKTVGGRRINVELQVAKQRDIVKRARFYSSVLDVYTQDTKSGRDYNLADTLVVFLCSQVAMPSSKDDFIWGKQVYWSRSGDEVLNGDGREIIFICYERYASARMKQVSELCCALAGRRPSNSFGLKLYKRLASLSGIKEVRQAVLTEEEKKAIREKALVEGRREATMEERARTAASLCKHFKTVEEAAVAAGLTVQEFSKALQYYKDYLA